MTEYSVQLPFMPTRPEQAVPFAAFVQRSGAARLWLGQSSHVDQHQVFAYAAGLGIRVAAGFGVSVMPLRHPIEAAIQARSVAAVTDRPVVAGFGPGAAALQASVHGAPYASPLTASREYLTLVRGLLDGSPMPRQGDYFSYRGALPKLNTPPVLVGLGVLQPRMARLAGEIADAVVTLLTPAAYLRDVLVPELRAAAAAAGRPVPKVVATVPIALAAPGRRPAELANTAHLRIPQYVRMLRLAGIPVDPADPMAGAQAAVTGGAFLYGEPDFIAAELKSYTDAGVDEVVLSLAGVCRLSGPQVALAELETLFSLGSLPSV